MYGFYCQALHKLRGYLIALTLALVCSVSLAEGLQTAVANPVLAERLKNAHVSEVSLGNGAKETQIKFAGSLEPNADIGCVGMDQITSQHNPPALIYAAKKCIRQDDYVKAWGLFITGTGFANYDLKRLADRSTAGAKTVLIINAFSDLNDGQRVQMGQKLKAFQADAAKVKAYCSALTKIGPPTYDPQWAILHGLGVYQGPHDGPYRTDVDTKAVWAEVLDSRCAVNTQ